MVGRSLSVPDTMTFPSMNISMSYYYSTLSPSPGPWCATCSPWAPHYQECQHIHKHDLLSVAMVSFTTFGCSVVSFLLKTQWITWSQMLYLQQEEQQHVSGWYCKWRSLWILQFVYYKTLCSFNMDVLTSNSSVIMSAMIAQASTTVLTLTGKSYFINCW